MTRNIVAYQQVQGPLLQMLAEIGSGEARPMASQSNPLGLGRFWCAADKPADYGTDFFLAPVYRTHAVPEDAMCEECSIGIRDLQQMVTEIVTSARARIADGTQ